MESIIEKQEMFDEYQNGPLVTIKKTIGTSSFITVFNKCWDYKDSMKNITFNTVTKPLEQPNVSFTEIDLKPVASLKIYKVTIKR